MCWGGGNGWMWNGGYGGGWSWVLTAVVLTLFFAVVITAIVVAVRYLTAGGRHPDQESAVRSAEDVLAQRFTRGEIDDTEYRKCMTALREHR
jgi:putative membrane protein